MKKNILTSLTIQLAVVWLSVSLYGARPAVAAPDSDAADKVFVGYVAGMPEGINYDLYTHLCHAFVAAEKDGSLISKQNVPSRELTREAHRHGVKVLISLGGWGWDENFAALALDPQAEDRYVSAVMELVDQYDYDGIDLDWEYPDTNIETVGFDRLCRRFRKALDELATKKNRPMLLTMAASAHPKTLEWLSNDLLLDTMDWVNVMTYDYSGGWTQFAGHHAPLHLSSQAPLGEALSAAQSVDYLRKRGLPANRIALGLPLYGRSFAVDQPYADTTAAGKPSADSYNYKQLAPLASNPKWRRVWDDETKTPWLIDADKPEVICYDDPQSIALKTEWAKTHDLRGVFFWQIDADRMPDGTNPLQEKAREALFR